MQRDFPGRTCLIELDTMDQAHAGKEAQQLANEVAKLTAAQLGTEYTGQVLPPSLMYSSSRRAHSSMPLWRAEPC